MDVAPCITLQSDMANLFDQYLFKDHNYEVTSTSSNLVMASEGYNSMPNFGEEDFTFQGLQLLPPSSAQLQNQNNNAMMTSPNSIHDTDHSLADIFTSPILTSMSQDVQEPVNNQYASYVTSCESSYPCSQNFSTQPIYTTSELKPSNQPVLNGMSPPSTDRVTMRSPQQHHQQHVYTTINHVHLATSNNHHQGPPVPQHRFNGPDRRPSSTGSASVGSSPASIHTSPGRESEDSDDSVPVTQVNGVFPLQNSIVMKRRSPEPDDNIPTTTVKAKIVKKPKVQKKKKKRDPNEPQKPVSAYALFFRDTQAAIKGQNPNASFGEVSKIVASMWDGLDVEHKNVYKKKTEAAKKEYLKALAAYRASIVCRTAPEHDLNMNSSIPRHPPQQMSMLQKKSPLLTSLMDNNSSRSQYIPQTAMSNPYGSVKGLPTAASIEGYPSYQPPVYKPPISVGFQRPASVNSYAQHQQNVNKNLMPSQIPNQGMMDAPPNSTPSIMSIEQQMTQHPHPGMNTMQPNPVMGSSPQHMPVPVSSPNHFINIQGDNMSNTNILIQNPGTQLDQPQISSSPPQMNQMQPTLPEQEPHVPPLQEPQMEQQPVEMNQAAKQAEVPVEAEQTNTTPTQEATQDSPDSALSTVAPTQSSVNTANATQLPNHTTSTLPAVNSSPQRVTCLREGCCNPIVESNEWDNEYCSSTCVVSHCRDVFSAWVSARQTGNNLNTVS